MRQRGCIILRQHGSCSICCSGCCRIRLCSLLPRELRARLRRLRRERRRPCCCYNCLWRPLARLLHRHLLEILSRLSSCRRAPSLRLLLARPDARRLLLRPSRRLLPLLWRLSILLWRPGTRLLRRLIIARLPLLVGQHSVLCCTQNPSRGARQRKTVL